MNSIKFYLSSALDSLVDDVDNAIFSVDGNPIYETATPLSLSQRVTTLNRIQDLPHTGEKMELQAPGEIPPPKYESVVTAIAGKTTKIGEIEYHEFSPSIFRYEGKTLPENEMFLKASFINTFLVGDRKFRGPDGQTYVWQKKIEGFELVRWHQHDKGVDIVARWSPRRFGIIHKEPLPPCLEVVTSAAHMLDLIFLTFVFFKYKS